VEVGQIGDFDTLIDLASLNSDDDYGCQAMKIEDRVILSETYDINMLELARKKSVEPISVDGCEILSTSISYYNQHLHEQRLHRACHPELHQDWRTTGF